MKVLSSLFALLLVLFVQVSGFAASPQAIRKVSEITEITFMTYNVENLFVSKINRDSEDSHYPGAPETLKSDEDLDGVAEAILEVNPDIMTVQEVDDLYALEKLNETRLDGAYNEYLIEGNDERGIDVGFLVKKNLPVDAVVETHKDVKWYDPIDKKNIKLFSRDLPALILTIKGHKKPFLIILGNHAKSKRDRSGDKESNMIRTAQHQAAMQIMQNYQNTYGQDTPIIFAGDFNTDVRKGKEVEPVRKMMKDAFDVAVETVPAKDRITHSFHPAGGSTVYAQIDGIFVSDILTASIIKASIYKYKNKDGSEKPLPRTYDERSANPSDHLPPWIVISTEGLLEP